MRKCHLEIDNHSTPHSIEVYTDQVSAFVYSNLKNVFYKILKKDSVCIDLGAHVGLISIIMSFIATKGHVYSFEPSRNIFDLLQKNVEENRLTNITPIQAAVFNLDGQLEFCNLEHLSGSSHLCTTSYHSSNQVTKSIRLDDWINQQNLNRVDCIKMDIEGSEIEALNSSLETIQRWKPDLVIEFNSVALTNMGHKPEDLLFLLQEIYPEIYIIKPDSSFYRVENYSDLISYTDSLKSYYQIDFNNGDLYCTFGLR